jgi:hypothetical protein
MKDRVTAEWLKDNIFSRPQEERKLFLDGNWPEDTGDETISDDMLAKKRKLKEAVKEQQERKERARIDALIVARASHLTKKDDPNAPTE